VRVVVLVVVVAVEVLVGEEREVLVAVVPAEVVVVMVAAVLALFMVAVVVVDMEVAVEAMVADIVGVMAVVGKPRRRQKRLPVLPKQLPVRRPRRQVVPGRRYG